MRADLGACSYQLGRPLRVSPVMLHTHAIATPLGCKNTRVRGRAALKAQPATDTLTKSTAALPCDGAEQRSAGPRMQTDAEHIYLSISREGGREGGRRARPDLDFVEEEQQLVGGQLADRLDRVVGSGLRRHVCRAEAELVKEPDDLRAHAHPPTHSSDGCAPTSCAHRTKRRMHRHRARISCTACAEGRESGCAELVRSRSKRR